MIRAGHVASLAVILLSGALAPAGQAPPGGMRPQPGGPPPGGMRPQPGMPQPGASFPPSGQPRQQRPGLHAGIEMRTYAFEPTGEQLEYAVFVPPRIKRSKSDTPVPLIIALHGLGMPPATIANGLAEAADRRGYIIAAPTGYRLNGWYGYQGPNPDQRTVEHSEQDVMNVLARMRADFNIDERQIFLVGSSMGGTGVLHLARKYPGTWAAVAALAPGVPDGGVGFEAVRGTPVMIMIGDRDQLIPIDTVRAAVARLRESGVALEYHEIRGGDHTSPDRQGMSQVFKFLDGHRADEAKPATGGASPRQPPRGAR